MQHVIDNVSRAKWVDEVVVASPHKIPDYKVEVWEDLDENDLLTRYYLSAKVNEADVIVRITSDCPFIDSNIIDMAITYYFKTSFPYVCFAPVDGLDVEVFSFRLLEEAWYNSKGEYDKEHVTPYMKRKTKLSIDTKEDLRKARQWYEFLR
ncbi:hypothetical protein AYK26_07795 [Euryarchaeota archaeon SM23-78]|nr:MAG: hypothetical protein AYK26_07795 [Euryarchaeota archaeon SM23-78]